MRNSLPIFDGNGRCYCWGLLYFITMNFLEKDLEQIIFEADNKHLNKRGLPIKGRKIRQLRIGNYGIADLITYQYKSYMDEYLNYVTNKLLITVYEFKKDEINTETLLQVIRYAKGIERWLEKNERLEFIEVDFEFVLCGKSINTKSNWVYLIDYFTNLEVYKYEYDIDGISFHETSQYHLTNEGF